MNARHQINGPTITLANGTYFDLENPDEADIDIGTIAHALSNICRYTGHCCRFYSVAQHSVLVSQNVPPEFALAGLLHDAAEAFIGDVAKPLKMILPDYQRIEARVEASVMARFGLPAKMSPEVKRADMVLLRTEQRDLMGANGHRWVYTEGLQPLEEVIEPVGPYEAYVLFMERFLELVGASK